MLEGDYRDVELRCVRQRKCTVIELEENAIRDDFMTMTRLWKEFLDQEQHNGIRKKKFVQSTIATDFRL